jgi:hypothetical protein
MMEFGDGHDGRVRAAASSAASIGADQPTHPYPSAGRAQTDQIRASELAAGDVIELEMDRLVVVEEPQVMHRGWSLFDQFELLIGLTVCPPGDLPRSRRLVLAPDAEVSVIGKAT